MAWGEGPFLKIVVAPQPPFQSNPCHAKPIPHEQACGRLSEHHLILLFKNDWQGGDLNSTSPKAWLHLRLMSRSIVWGETCILSRKTISICTSVPVWHVCCCLAYVLFHHAFLKKVSFKGSMPSLIKKIGYTLDVVKHPLWSVYPKEFFKFVHYWSSQKCSCSITMLLGGRCYCQQTAFFLCLD